MTCEDAHSHMHDYISGELAPEHHQPLMDHFAECINCSRMFDQTRQLQSKVKSFMQYEAPAELQSSVSQIFSSF